jgi:hypothetical protein
MSPYYFLAPEAIRTVNELFSLPASGSEQDWEVEMACAERRAEFFGALASGALTNDPETEAAVAALFIGSADDAIGLGQFSMDENFAARDFFQKRPDLRAKMATLWFQRGAPIHAETIGAWLK